MAPTLRRARRSDAAALTRLARLSKRSNGYDDAFMDACAAELEVTPAALDAHPCFVAEAAGEIVGFVLLEAAGQEGEIAAFFIHPARQRRGIGRLLWTATLGEARVQGLGALHLDADPAAEGFYRRMGFRTVGRTPSASIPGRSLPHMRMALRG